MTDEEIKALQDKNAALEKANAAASQELEDAYAINKEQSDKIDSLSSRMERAAAFPVVKLDGVEYEVRLKSFNHNGQFIKADELQSDSETLASLVAYNPEWLVSLAPEKDKKKKNRNS